MTTQSLIAAQSFGTSTNVGNNKFSIAPATLAAATSAFVINAQITAPATGFAGHGTVVRVWYTTTMRTVTAANAPLTLAATARYLDIACPDGASLVVSKDSALEPKTGSSLHVWVEAPPCALAHTLAVDVVEVPS